MYGSNGHVYALNATSGTELWNYTAGSFESAPSVVGGVVYVGCADNNVYALNASTGSLLWNYATGGYVWSSPAVVNGVVYVGSSDGYVYALGPSPPVPEFPSFFILPLLLVATLAAAVILKDLLVQKNNARTPRKGK